MNLFRKKLVMIFCLGSSMATLLADDPGQKRKIDLPVPIGHPVTGLHVPVYNADGKLELELDTESAMRADPTNVQMKTVAIQTFDDKTGKPDLRILLKTANLNTDTNIVTSEEPIHVTRSDFELTGDSMEFAHDTRQAIVKGNVRMLIYNRQTAESKSQPNGQQK
jgi:lipopolysaccharide assembly outer membrane protein LptD (OstA)